MKTKQKKSRKNLTPVVLTLSLLALVIAGLFTFGRGYFTSKYSEAESKNYNKTYPAGDIVNYGWTTIRKDSGIQGDVPFVSMKSIGKNIKMPARPEGPLINGWRSPLVDSSTYDRLFKRLKPNKNAVIPSLTQYVPAWSYLSKEITIPKDNSNKPMALYVCWKSLSGKDASLKFQFAGPTLSKKNSQELWGSKFDRYHMAYTHRSEHGNNEWQKIKCWGFYDIAYSSNKKINKSKSIKARVNIKVFGQVEIASIKVFHPTQPPERVTVARNYYDRQFESDITN